MIRFDALEEYKGIDAVMDYIKGYSIYTVIGKIGTACAVALSSKSTLKAIIMLISTFIAASALSEPYLERSTTYLVNKIIEKINKKLQKMNEK